MAKKPHLYLRNPVEGVVRFKQSVRYPGDREEEPEKDYTPMQQDFIRSRDNFFRDKQSREAQRNARLNVPSHIDLIELHFFDSFDTSFFENRYRVNFGLSPVRFSEFNTKGLFAVVDQTGFNNFIASVRAFIETRDHKGEVEYNTDIKFIREFFFHSSERMKTYNQLLDHIVINLIDNPEIFREQIAPIENDLIAYLQARQVSFFPDLANNRLEIVGPGVAFVDEILNNFDVIQSVSSYLAGVIGPNAFNLPVRSYGFTINNANDPTAPSG